MRAQAGAGLIKRGKLNCRHVPCLPPPARCLVPIALLITPVWLALVLAKGCRKREPDKEVGAMKSLVSHCSRTIRPLVALLVTATVVLAILLSAGSASAAPTLSVSKSGGSTLLGGQALICDPTYPNHFVAVHNHDPSDRPSVAAHRYAIGENTSVDRGNNAQGRAGHRAAPSPDQQTPKGRCTRNWRTNYLSRRSSTCHRKRRSLNSGPEHSRPDSPAREPAAENMAG